ncbi:MAG: polysaccharide biosynthesis C-terminal domain-containing protein [Clostridiales bacterium]|nr:polysaccharide biosynthesis C-terminal domain-containing protein [Clostridiales bacterium]
MAAVLGGEQHYAEAYGAAGGTLGTSMGALAGLIFCIAIFLFYRKTFKKDIASERTAGTGQVESYRSIIKVLILTILPILVSTTLYNLVSIVDQGLFKNLAIHQGNAADTVSLWWGVYSGYYKVLINVPIAISTAIATSSVPAVAAAFARKNRPEVKRKIGLAMRFVMVVAFPCAVGIGVLATPIINMLFHTTTDLAGSLLRWGAISVIFYSISTLSNAILQGIDRMRIPIRNAVIALAVNCVSLPISIYVFHIGIYAMIVGNIVFSLVMCILNSFSVKRYSGYSPNIRKTYVKPAIAAVIMGVIVGVVYLLIHMALHSNTIATIIAIVVGVISYAVILLLTGGLTETDLQSFPRGAFIIKISKKLHLLR